MNNYACPGPCGQPVRIEKVGWPGQTLIRAHEDGKGGVCVWSEAAPPVGWGTPPFAVPITTPEPVPEPAPRGPFVPMSGMTPREVQVLQATAMGMCKAKQEEQRGN